MKVKHWKGKVAKVAALWYAGLAPKISKSLVSPIHLENFKLASLAALAPLE